MASRESRGYTPLGPLSLKSKLISSIERCCHPYKQKDADQLNSRPRAVRAISPTTATPIMRPSRSAGLLHGSRHIALRALLVKRLQRAQREPPPVVHQIAPQVGQGSFLRLLRA